MPYASVKDLPADQVKHYGAHQRRAFLAAFNSAMAEHGDESKAFAIAHTAAKNAGHEEANPRKAAKKGMHKRMEQE